MPFLENIRHPIDTLRTAPVGFSLAGLGVTLASESIGEIVNNPNILVKAASIVQMGMEFGFAATGICMVTGQFKLRRRLEQSIDRSGYNTRVMAHTVNTFCDRQTGKVVSRNAGHAEDYKALTAVARDLRRNTAVDAYINRLSADERDRQ